MRQLVFLLCLLGASQFVLSCNKPIICSEEFRIIAVTVRGGALDDYYTIRTSRDETIRHNDLYTPGQNWYPVLTDNYQPNMINREETFRFVGIVDSAVVVDQEYVIRADKCHIYKVSGPDTVRF